MQEFAALIKELSQVVRDLNAQNKDEFSRTKINKRLSEIEQKADAVLPENPYKHGLSPQRSPEEWEKLTGKHD